MTHEARISSLDGQTVARRRSRIRDGVGFGVFCYVIMGLFTLACILPVLNVIALSFSDARYNGSVGLVPLHFTLYSYGVALSAPAFYKAFFISVGVCIATTLLSLLTMMMAAYPLSKKDLPFRNGIMMYFLFIMLFSGGVVPTFLWFKIIKVNDTIVALILPMVVQVYNLVLIKTFFENLPASIEEAAQLDGANNYLILFRIVVPMSVPIIITVCLFTVVGVWNNYQLALYYLPTNHGLYPLAMYILNFINGSAVNDMYGDQKRALYRDNIEAAIVILSIIPIVATYPFFLKYFSHGVAVGAVKE